VTSSAGFAASAASTRSLPWYSLPSCTTCDASRTHSNFMAYLGLVPREHSSGERRSGIHHAEKFDDRLNVTDEGTSEFVGKLSGGLVDWSNRLSR
jgi:hypothetical protein